MRLLADECVFRVTTEFLRKAGHDVLTAQDVSLAGESDEHVIAQATRTESIF